jgi:hypothetical protein
VVRAACHHRHNGRAAWHITLCWYEAEAAARSRRFPRARRFLRWILACCPEEEDAWLWLARLASSKYARQAYLRQAYAFHPQSTRVQAALRQARRQQLESAVGELKPKASVLHCLPDDRRVRQSPNNNFRPATHPPTGWRRW